MIDISDTHATGADNDDTTRPVIQISPGRQKRVRSGHPWIFSNEIEMSPETKALARGTLVNIVDAAGSAIGTAVFNPNTLISARLLTSHCFANIDIGWLAAKMAAAATLRDRLYDRPFYRLIHAEADGLPGLIIDRYGDNCVVQINTAGMELLSADIVSALGQTIAPAGIVLQRESAARHLEGLPDVAPEIIGDVPSPATLSENGVEFLADLSDGQKTGWFFDHRENRARVAALSAGQRVADVYSYLGGFGLQAAAAGASEVVFIDRSKPALDLAAEAATRSGLAGACRFEKSEAFAALEKLAADKEKFGVVVIDPPAFVKSKKDLKPGARGYRKLTRLAAKIVEHSGILCTASCSHHLPMETYAEQVRRGIHDAGRTARILHVGGAGPDHPLHPHLPESNYLKTILMQVD
jgi:23S rRNA (cytosine1962-C5)-methyltransferase